MTSDNADVSMNSDFSDRDDYGTESSKVSKGKGRASRLPEESDFESADDDDDYSDYLDENEDDDEADDYDEDLNEDREDDDNARNESPAPSQQEHNAGDDEEVFYLPLDLSAAPQSLDNLSNFKIVNLHTANPLVSIGSRVYEGQWEDLIGTDLFFTQEAELVGLSRQQIKLHPGKLVKKEEAEKQDQGRLDGIDWAKPSKTQNKKLTLKDKVMEINRRKTEAALLGTGESVDTEMGGVNEG